MKLDIVVLLLAISCGSPKTSRPTPPPEPVPDDVIPTRPEPPKGSGDPVDPTEKKLTFIGDVKPILKADCALSGCHYGATMFEDEESFLRSNSMRRIENGSMPPRLSSRYDQWTDEKKALIFEWFNSD